MVGNWADMDEIPDQKSHTVREQKNWQRRLTRHSSRLWHYHPANDGYSQLQRQHVVHERSPDEQLIANAFYRETHSSGVHAVLITETAVTLISSCVSPLLACYSVISVVTLLRTLKTRHCSSGDAVKVNDRSNSILWHAVERINADLPTY